MPPPPAGHKWKEVRHDNTVSLNVCLCLSLLSLNISVCLYLCVCLCLFVCRFVSLSYVLVFTGDYSQLDGDDNENKDLSLCLFDNNNNNNNNMPTGFMVSSVRRRQDRWPDTMS